MKPQSLQDAIKAAALKKRNKADSGQWKAPVVKKHTISKEEYEAEKLQGSKKAVSPSGGGAMSSTQLEQFQQQLSQMNQQWNRQREDILKELKLLKDIVQAQRDMIDALRNGAAVDAAPASSRSSSSNGSPGEIAALREQVEEINNTLAIVRSNATYTEEELETVKVEVESLSMRPKSGGGGSGGSSADVEMLTVDVKALHKKVAGSVSSIEFKVLKQQVEAMETGKKSSAPSPDFSTEIKELRHQLAELQTAVSTANPDVEALREELDVLKDQVASTPSVKVSKTPKTPKTPGTKKLKADAAKLMSSASPGLQTETPTEHSSSDVILVPTKPLSVEQIVEGQRKDKLLKQFLQSNGGDALPYTYKSMSLPDYPLSEGNGTKSLVCFKGRIYVPSKLRETTMDNLLKQYPYEAGTILNQRFIWPDCAADLKAFKQKMRER